MPLKQQGNSWKRAQSLAPAFEASMGWTEGPVIHFWAPKLVHSLGKGLDGISGSAALPLSRRLQVIAL
ncbi:hypothetical protein D910_00258 [Dendroctonus ponderosae]|uniref:Uncharacterized protein n=1 Tax=Dendroctonus ponderosae TaxID=77166 RepID=U4UNV5_DENPD|nr:hypothetical protein D910_00258 [Dendroctonus ponderosae]